MSVIVDSLPGNTKNRESTRSWTARVRLFHPWAVTCERKLRLLSHVNHDAFMCVLNVKGGVKIHMWMRMWKEGIDTSSSPHSHVNHDVFMCAAMNHLHVHQCSFICSLWRGWMNHYIFWVYVCGWVCMCKFVYVHWVMTELNETLHILYVHHNGAEWNAP